MTLTLRKPSCSTWTTWQRPFLSTITLLATVVGLLSPSWTASTGQVSLSSTFLILNQSKLFTYKQRYLFSDVCDFRKTSSFFFFSFLFKHGPKKNMFLNIFYQISCFKMIFPPEIIKMCYIQQYNSYLTNNRKYNQNRQHILYIPYNNMEIIVMTTTLLLHHPFCRNPNRNNYIL